MTLAGLGGCIQATHASTKADLPWLKLAIFGDTPSDKGSLRHNANVRAVSGAEGDYDGEVMGFDEAREIVRQADVLALLYTSPSYTPEKPRWRILCPFSTELAPEERSRMMARVNGLFRGVLAGESHTLSQSYYYGSIGDNPPPRVEVIDGTPIDLRDDLDATAIGKSTTPKGAAPKAVTGAVIPFAIPGTPPAVLTARLSAMNAAAQAGMQPSWFDGLDTAQKNEMLRAIATHPVFIKLADQSRDEWRQIGWGFADAERRGATDAHECFVAWSIAGASTDHPYTDEGAANVWKSFDPHRPGGVTVGTVITAADKARVDLSRWRDAARATTTTVVSPSSTPAAPSPARSFFAPVPFDAASLRPVPWLAPGLLLRGETSVFAGQGGGAKTATAIALAVSAAAGRQNFGPFSINSRAGGLRVGLISAEEDRGRAGLLIAAAANISALTPVERSLVAQNLVLHDAQESGWRLGEPRPNTREDIAPADHDQALATLEAAIAGLDVLILDTMAALLAAPNENDNNVVTALLRRLGRAARRAGCAVLLLHHTPKMTREAAAAQRGEATLVRGGSAITNSARVVLSLTTLPAAEAGAFVVQGLAADRIHRIEHVKINDMPSMDPTYINVVSEKVKVHDGSEHAVRAVEFIAAPDLTPAGIPVATKHLAMTVIKQGGVDEHGAAVPLSPSTAGRKNARNVVDAIARALVGANPLLTEPQARAEAQRALKHLTDIGVVTEGPVKVPTYKPDGSPNGSRDRQGLICHPERAPWVQP